MFELLVPPVRFNISELTREMKGERSMEPDIISDP